LPDNSQRFTEYELAEIRCCPMMIWSTLP